MIDLEHQVVVVSQGRVGQDRAAVFSRGSELIAVVADGAGGTSGGAEAATFVIESVRRFVDSGATLGAWPQLLMDASDALENVGQTTAVVVGAGSGASVGDSEAWLIKPDEVVDLTAGQRRKPLLGGGAVEPLMFEITLDPGDTLLVASDGLFKYTRRETICQLARSPTLAAEALIDAVRLRSGALQDDVAVVLIRRP